MVNNDVDLRHVRDTLGHELISTTNTYLHSSDDVRHAKTEAKHKVRWREAPEMSPASPLFVDANIESAQFPLRGHEDIPKNRPATSSDLNDRHRRMMLGLTVRGYSSAEKQWRIASAKSIPLIHPGLTSYRMPSL